MGQPVYSYQRHSNGFKYTFVSVGKLKILKVVVFAPTSLNNIFNLGLGDLMDDGTIDDTINSNNGDIIKVLSTVIRILGEFINEHPNAKVSFTGSTPSRTALYKRIIKTYRSSFGNEFIVSSLIEHNNEFKEVPFDHIENEECLGFFIQRIN